MNSDLDPEFVELIDAVGERRAQALIAAAVAVAAASELMPISWVPIR